jgi:hypothetical protein
MILNLRLENRMVEEEWLVSDNPEQMLGFLRLRDAVQKCFIDLPIHLRKLAKAQKLKKAQFFLDRATRTVGHATASGMAENVHAYWRWSARKTRLFAVACCRRIYQLRKNKLNQEAIDIAERFADDLATEDDLIAAQRKLLQGWSTKAGQAKRAVIFTVAEACLYRDYGSSEAALVANAAVRAAVRKEKRTKRPNAEVAERAAQADLLRCIFPDPFRPVVLDSSLLAWRDGRIAILAQSIYEERAFMRLPILADALEEAGCANAQALEHCRQSTEHVRGCWVVDLLLGKS